MNQRWVYFVFIKYFYKREAIIAIMIIIANQFPGLNSVHTIFILEINANIYVLTCDKFATVTLYLLQRIHTGIYPYLAPQYHVAWYPGVARWLNPESANTVGRLNNNQHPYRTTAVEQSMVERGLGWTTHWCFVIDGFVSTIRRWLCYVVALPVYFM